MEAPIRELVLTRMLPAPRDKVFRAFTDERSLARWWGPTAFTIFYCELDVRAGGSIKIKMTDVDGGVFTMVGIFRIVDPPMHLLFTTEAFENDSGFYTLQYINSVTLDEITGKTKLVLKIEVVESSPNYHNTLKMMEKNWKESFDKLDAILKK